MKNLYKTIAIFSVTLLFIACSNDDKDYGNIHEGKSFTDIILKERGANLPDVVTKDIVLEQRRQTKATGVNGEIIGNSDVLLGYSYNIGNSILGDYDNVISPVVDLSKVKALSSEYITPKQLLGNVTRSITYGSFDRYEYNSSITKTVASGFNLKIGIFSFGRKKTTTEIFTTQITNSNNSVYGELNLNVRNSSFALQTVEGSRKIYARQCLSNTFNKNLYSSTIGGLIDSYGDFVLTGYVTGGKAFGMYAGLASTGSTLDKKEKDMKHDIDASFTWKSGTNNNSASGNLNFGKKSGSGTETEYSLSKTEVIIRTYGGDQSGQAVVGAVELNKLQLDLSLWLNSLSNVNKHTIIDVLDQGLAPLSYFVLEQNFKKRFDDTSSGVLEKRTKLINPYIEIVKVYVRTSSSGTPLYEVAAVLNTRQGDKIILSDGKSASASDSELLANENNVTFMAKANAIVAEKRKYYDVGFRANEGIRINPSLRTPLSIKLDKFNEATMYRYRNPNTGMEYIYDTANKVAYSHLTDPLDEDWILDEYGIRDWVESLSSKSISMATLANSYKIIGL